MTDQEKLVKIKELIKPFKKWLYQSDDYACAKNEKQRQKIISNGVLTQQQMEDNLKIIENLLQ